MKSHPIGKTIKEFRHARGWSQSVAAYHLGISLRTVIALETGSERKPRPLTLAKINMSMRAIEANGVAA